MTFNWFGEVGLHTVWTFEENMLWKTRWYPIAVRFKFLKSVGARTRELIALMGQNVVIFLASRSLEVLKVVDFGEVNLFFIETRRWREFNVSATDFYVWMLSTRWARVRCGYDIVWWSHDMSRLKKIMCYEGNVISWVINELMNALMGTFYNDAGHDAIYFDGLYFPIRVNVL